MAAWKLPLVGSAIALPIVAGFYVGGPGLGMAVGALSAATIIVLAVRKPPLEQVAIAAAPDARPRLLVVLGAALEVSGAAAVAALAKDATLAGAPAEVLLIAPCRSGFAATELVLVDGQTDAAKTLAFRLPIQLHQVQPADERAETRPALAQPGVSIQRTIRPLRTS